MDVESPQSIGADQLAQGMARRRDSRIAAEGAVSFPAVPAMLDEYTAKCLRVFAGLGREFSESEQAHLRSVLERQLGEAFSRSQRSVVTVSYRSPVSASLSYEVTISAPTIEEVYREWVANRKPPLFGVEPDARVWALSAEAPDPAQCPVLEIGAGTGRNALALAKRGHPVDVVEITTAFADIIGQAAQRDSLPVRVINRDVFQADGDLRRDYGLIVLSEVVSDFRSPGQLRGLLELASRCLSPAGRLVFNIFLTRGDYVPDDAARQFGQQVYTSFFTRDELTEACDGLPLRLESDDCVHDYEKQNLPDGAWPPTGWYAAWVSGRDAFDVDFEQRPIDMRWLVYRRTVTASR